MVVYVAEVLVLMLEREGTGMGGRWWVEDKVVDVLEMQEVRGGR